MDATLIQTCRQYLATKSAIESAQEALAILETRIKAEMVASEESQIECDGKTITLVKAERRVFDADALKRLLKPGLFKLVTKTEVSNSLIDAAVATGKVSSSVIEQAMKTTPYTQIRIK